MENIKFEKMNDALFQKIDAEQMKSIKGGYTVVSTCCTSNAWGTTCTDENIDKDPCQ
ncbi:MAG: TIGR04149 family rSAM-modified RiPP [Bacteroidota bacterium]